MTDLDPTEPPRPPGPPRPADEPKTMLVPRRDAAAAPAAPAAPPQGDHAKTMLVPRRDAAPPPQSTPEAFERAEQRTMLVPRREADAQLPAGTALEEFVVEKVLGIGGYSIVYAARDTRLDRRVAIKEYLPATLASRAPDGQVLPRLPRFEPAFAKGMESFINEARLLGALEHPSLVKVWRFWQANGTAYMVMPLYEGITLKAWLAQLGAPPSERWLRALLDPLLEVLELLHAQGIVHRDVAPDNILMLYDRTQRDYAGQPPKPVLLDFGAARRVAAEATQQLTAILKTGYSPVEQYDAGHAMKPGPWSDLYSVGALVYAAATGKPPGPSIARLVRDELVPARVAARGTYGPALLAAVDAALVVRPEGRPQSVAAFRALLTRPDAAQPDITLPAAAPSAVDLPLDAPAAGHARRADPAAGSRRWAVAAAALAGALLLAALAWAVLGRG